MELLQRGERPEMHCIQMSAIWLLLAGNKTDRYSMRYVWLLRLVHLCNTLLSYEQHVTKLGCESLLFVIIEVP